MKSRTTPYKCHLFVCVKTRGGEEKSCGDGQNAELKTMLKDEIKDRGWKGIVRVSESSCMGLCAAGPNVMIYPQKIWFSGVALSDVPEILQTVEKLIAE